MDLLNRGLSAVLRHTNYCSPQCNEAPTGNLLVRFREILVIYRAAYRDQGSRVSVAFRLDRKIQHLWHAKKNYIYFQLNIIKNIVRKIDSFETSYHVRNKLTYYLLMKYIIRAAL